MLCLGILCPRSTTCPLPTPSGWDHVHQLAACFHEADRAPKFLTSWKLRKSCFLQLSSLSFQLLIFLISLEGLQDHDMYAANPHILKPSASPAWTESVPSECYLRFSQVTLQNCLASATGVLGWFKPLQGNNREPTATFRTCNRLKPSRAVLPAKTHPYPMVLWLQNKCWRKDFTSRKWIIANKLKWYPRRNRKTVPMGWRGYILRHTLVHLESLACLASHRLLTARLRVRKPTHHLPKHPGIFHNWCEPPQFRFTTSWNRTWKLQYKYGTVCETQRKSKQARTFSTWSLPLKVWRASLHSCLIPWKWSSGETYVFDRIWS